VNADVPPMVDLLAWSMLAKRPFFRASSAETVARRLRELREELDGALAAHARDEGVSPAAETMDERASGDRSLVLTLDHQDDAPSAEIFVQALRELGEEEVDGLLAAHARDEGVAAAETTDERASGDRNVVLTLDHQGDERTPSTEIFVYPFRELREVTDGALAAHARGEEVSAAAETTDERASGDRNVAPMPGDRGDDHAPSAGIFVHPLRELREEEGDGVFAAQARAEGVSAAAETTDERASGDRDVALTLDHRGDEDTPSAGIFFHPLRELREEEGDGVFAARGRDEEASAAAETTDERASGDRDVALTLDHRGDADTPRAEVSVHSLEEVREEVDGALAEPARDERMSAAAETTDERTSGDVAPMPGDRGEDRAPTAEIFVYPLHELSEEVDGALAEPARDERMSAAAETTDERAPGDVALMPGHRGEDRAPTAEIFAYPLRELREVDGALTEHVRDEGMSAAAETTDERTSGDAALMAVHRGTTKRRLQSYALTVLILAATGSAFLWQWRESLDSSEADTATPSKEPAIASTFGPVIPDESHLAASEPEPNQAASEPEPNQAASEPEPNQAASEPEPKQATPEPEPKQTASEQLELTPVASEPEPKETASVPQAAHAAPEPQPKKAASEQQPKERVTKALARKPSRSAVASGSAPARGAEPAAVALAPEPAPAKLPPLVKSAKVVFDVSPWGEIYVDGKRHGTTPPLNTIDLPPGSHRIEVRNPTQPPYIVHEMLEPGDVRPIQYRFE